MKGKLNLFLVIALLMANIGISSVYANNNLISNSGFEDGITGWTNEVPVQFSLDTTVSRTGTSSIKYISTEGQAVPGGSFLVTTAIPCSPSTSYVFSVWYKAEKGVGCSDDLTSITSTAFAGFDVRDNAGTIVGNDGKNMIIDGQWHKYSAIIKTAAGASAFGTIRIRPFSIHDITYHFDDFELRTATSEDTNNLGFEYGTAGWQNDFTAGIGVTNTEKYSGESSLRIISNPSANAQWFNSTAVSDGVNLTAGKKYLFSFWYKMDSVGKPLTQNGDNSFAVILRANSGTQLDYISTNGGRLINDNRWHRYVKAFTAVSGSLDITHFALRNYNKLDGAVYYFDDFELTELSDNDSIAEYLAANGSNVFENPAYDTELANGDFEQGNIYPWYAESGISIAYDSSQGRNAMKVSSANAAGSVCYRTIALKPNATYNMTFWYKTETLDATEVSFYVSSVKTAWYGNEPHFINRVNLEPSETWTKFSRSFTNDSSQLAVIRIRREATTSKTVYFDDFSIREIEPFSATIVPNMQALTANANFTLSVSILNEPEITKNVIAAIALYDTLNNKMEMLDADEYTYTAVNNQDISLGFTLPASVQNKLLKIFVWDSDTMKPIGTYLPISN